LIVGKFVVFRVHENIFYFSYDNEMPKAKNDKEPKEVPKVTNAVQTVPINQFTFF